MEAIDHDSRTTRSQRVVRACAEFLLRHRALPFVLAFTLSAFAGYHALALRVDNSVETWLPEDSSTRAGLAKLEDAFGDQHAFQIVVRGDVFSAAYLNRLRQLHAEVAQVQLEPLGHAAPRQVSPDAFFDGFGATSEAKPGIERVVSLINVPQPQRVGDTLSFRRLEQQWPAEAELPAVRARMLADPALAGTVVAEDASYSTLSATARVPEVEDEERIYRALRDIVAKYTQPGFSPSLAGISAFNAAQQILTFEDVVRLIVATSFSTLVLLFFLFRHPLGVVGPALVVGQSIICTLGFMAGVGQPLTTVTSMLPAFLLVVGSGATIHMQTVYRDYRRCGIENREAIIKTLESTAIPIIMTEVTTGLGLLSFLTATLKTIRDLGLYGTLGLTISLLFSLTLVPVVLSFNRTSLLGAHAASTDGAPQPQTVLDRFVTWCNQLSRSRRSDTGAVLTVRRDRTLIAAIVLTLVSVAGISTLQSGHNQLKWFPADHPVRKTMESLEVDGGTSNFVLLLNAREPGGLSNRELLLALDQFDAYAKAYRDPETQAALVSETVSAANLVRQAAKSMYGSAEPGGEIPSTQRAVSDMFTLLESSAAEELRQFVTLDMSQGVVLVRVHWTNAHAYGALTEYLEQGVRRLLDEHASVSITGLSKGYFDVVAPILNDLVSSFSTASLVVTLLVLLILRDVKMGLIAMIPNILPIAFLLGFMGITGVPIDVSNMLIASVALGIVVDDTIHLLYQFKWHFQRYGRVEDALDYAFTHAGTGVAAMSLVLAINFLLFGVAQMRNLQMVGVLLAITVLVAFVVELIVTPALLRWAYRDRQEVLRESKQAVVAIS